jgi:hypothetical protein
LLIWFFLTYHALRITRRAIPPMQDLLKPFRAWSTAAATGCFLSADFGF